MSDASSGRDTTSSTNEQHASEPLRYPTDHVVGVLETEDDVQAAVDALTNGGFLASEVEIASGPQAAERLRTMTGRTGLANLAIRIAERLGIEDDEMRLKSRHEAALRDGRFIVLVSAPTDERRDRAVELLRARGAKMLTYMGRFTIEEFSPADEG